MDLLVIGEITLIANGSITAGNGVIPAGGGKVSNTANYGAAAKCAIALQSVSDTQSFNALVNIH